MLFSLAFSLALAPSLVLGAGLDDWRSRSIYQVVTDRFATSDGSTPFCDTGARKYCGGTWKGITRQLNYIKSMGFDAVWISPVVANVEGQTHYGEAYHGYWTSDLNALNAHFGSAEDLKALSKALHDQGMYLMVDVVANHMGPNISASANFSSDDAFSIYKPFSDASSFHPFQFINGTSYAFDTANQTDLEVSWIGEPVSPLPDINTENTTIVKTLNDWVKNLVSEYSVDGLRIDTVKHVRQSFWPDFRSAAGVFTMGEVVHDHVEYVSNYTHVLDSVLDYPTYFKLFSAFTSDPGKGNLSAVAESIAATQALYEHGASSIGSFVENHDQPRMLSKVKDVSLALNALIWPFIHDGIPILYYGQEQGLSGGEDPNNREALWFSDYKRNGPLFRHVTALNSARKAAISAKQNFLTTPMTFPPQPNGSTTALVVTKAPLVALLTNVGRGGSTEWVIPKGTYKPGTRVIDVITCAQVSTENVTADGDLVVSSINGMPQVLIPSEIYKSSTKKHDMLCSHPLNAANDNHSTPTRPVASSGFSTLCIMAAVWIALMAV
ncbi:hypothetical protein ONZ45_g4065 [Pleurotus djamor]|nr:hypothetical protein ONZ45_g4065 [Pleurotus djamor]